MSKVKAFTLIEVLIVIAVIGIISGIVIVQMNGAINATKDATRKADLNTIKKALTIYQAQTGKPLPTEPGCNIGSCTNLDAALDGIIPDSFSSTYTYSSDGTSYTVSSVLSSGYAYQYNSATGTYSTLEPTPGVCGSSNGANLSSIPSTNLCNAGTASSVSGSGPWSWTCAGTNSGITASCATGGIPVAGACGSANGKTYSSLATSYGSDTICTSGNQNPTTVNFPDAGSSSSWTCVGQNSGTTDSCSAFRHASLSCPSSATCSTVGTDYVIKWTTVGSYTWTVPSGVSSAKVLVVAGGGGGGYGYGQNGGGGGAGGLVYHASYSLSGNIPITVGGGGAPAPSNSAPGFNGSNSVFGAITALGGGGGGNTNAAATAGGSGGGGCDLNYPTGGAATQGNSGGGTGYGHAGGNGYYSNPYPAGGGGGAGAVGTTGSNPTGGIGMQFDITGTSVYYAGGGGGFSNSVGGAAGGLGGGGAGPNNPGSPNTGGGGGGSGGGVGAGGSGGSGVVIVRFAAP